MLPDEIKIHIITYLEIKEIKEIKKKIVKKLLNYIKKSVLHLLTFKTPIYL